MNSYTREEFHDLVWATAPDELSERLGNTVWQLAKTCHVHLVPFPPKGYWQKIQSGQPTKRTPLRSVENAVIQRVVRGNNAPSVASAYALAIFKQSPEVAEGVHRDHQGRGSESK